MNQKNISAKNNRVYKYAFLKKRWRLDQWDVSPQVYNKAMHFLCVSISIT